MTTGTPHQTDRPRLPRRSLARRLVPLSVASWAVLEIWLLILVGETFGGLTVLALLLGGAVLGAVAIRRAGRRAWRGLVEGLQQDSRPGARPEPRAAGGREATLPLLGGLLLMVPGLVSDVAGLLCLFPPTAALLRRLGERTLAERMQSAAPGTLGDALRQARIHRPDGKVVQGEVIRDDERSGRKPGSDDEWRPPLAR